MDSKAPLRGLMTKGAVFDLVLCYLTDESEWWEASGSVADLWRRRRRRLKSQRAGAGLD